MIPEFLLADLPGDLRSRIRSQPEKYILFLDLETEGLSKERNGITVLGTLAEGFYRAYVSGINLEKGKERLRRYPVWVTFGGTYFDLPFLKAHFKDLCDPFLHIDLQRLFRRLGIKGGLKVLERRFGISRQTQGLSGYDAVKLWQKWRRKGDRQALRTLLLYNREDVVNLESLLRIVYQQFQLTGSSEINTLCQEAGLGGKR